MAPAMPSCWPIPRATITEANQRAEELLGYSEAELLGMNYNQIHPPEILDHVRENFAGDIDHGFRSAT